MENNTTDLKSFFYLENGIVEYSNLDTIETSKVLKKGYYDLTWLPYPKNRLEVAKVEDIEKLSPIGFADKETLYNLMQAFFDKSIIEVMKSLNICHKTGFLLYGREGTGKTTIIKNMCNFLIENNNALVFFIENNYEGFNPQINLIKGIRKIQSNPIILVFDEFDGFMKHHHNSLKNLLDGQNSITNSITMASTNYIEEIPDDLKNRKSRFKYVISVESIQNQEEVLSILTPMLECIHNEKELEEYSKILTGSTLDQIKQFALDKLMNLKSHSTSKPIVGFNKNN